MQTSRLLLVVVGDIEPQEIETAPVAGKFRKNCRAAIQTKNRLFPALDFFKSDIGT
jgi:hypothetical protein